MKSSLKLVAVGAMVAAGLMFGSGTAHALNTDPTAALCAQIAQSAANEGHTMAVEMAEYGVSGCVGGPTTGPSAALCAAIALQAPNEGHTFAEEQAEWGVTGCPDPGTTPPPAGTPSAALCASIALQAPNEGHSFYEEMIEWGVTGCPGADTIAGRTAVLGASAGPRGAAPAASLSPAVLSASAAPTATSGRLPITGGDIAGLLTVALVGVAIGGGLLLVDKRRRSAAA